MAKGCVMLLLAMYLVTVQAAMECKDIKDQPKCLSCAMEGKMCMSTKGGDGGCMKMDPCLDCEWMNGMCMQAANPSSGSPQMVMTFYQSKQVVILFDSWSVKTTGEYILAVFLTFAASVGTALLRDYTHRCKHHLAFRCVLMFATVTLIYAIMLVTMTMNAGLFFAVMAGLTVAWAITEAVTAKSKSSSSGDIDEDGVNYTRLASCH